MQGKRDLEQATNTIRLNTEALIPEIIICNSSSSQLFMTSSLTWF